MKSMSLKCIRSCRFSGVEIWAIVCIVVGVLAPSLVGERYVQAEPVAGKDSVTGGTVPETVNMCEYWPFEVGNRWDSVTVFDGGFNMEIRDHIVVNGFDVWELFISEGRNGAPVRTTSYRVYVDGFMYGTSTREDLDSLPDVVGDMEALFPEMVEIGVPFVLPGSDGTALTAIRGSLSDVVGQVSLSTQDFPLGDQPDVIIFADKADFSSRIYARSVGPVLFGDAVAKVTINGGCGLTSEHITLESSLPGGQGDLSGLEDIFAMNVSEDGRFAFGLTAKTIALFSRDTATGALSLLETFTENEGETENSADVAGMAASPDGLNLYVTHRSNRTLSNNSLSVFLLRDSEIAVLNLLEVHREAENDVNGLNGASRVAVSPDGAYVYVASFEEPGIAAFMRDPSTGLLTFLDAYTVGQDAGSQRIADLAISADGLSLYYVGFGTVNIVNFSRNVSTGVLTRESDFVGDPVEGEIALLTALEVAPDNANVYATAYIVREVDHETVVTGSMLVFARSADTGSLTLLETHQGFDNVAAGLIGPVDVAVASNGLNVYTSGNTGNGVSVFARDLQTGRLKLIQGVKDGIGGIETLAGPVFFALSRENSHLYVPAQDDNAINIFAIAPALLTEGEGEGAVVEGDGENTSEGDGELADGGGETPEGEGEPSPEGEAPAEGASEGAIDGDGEDTGCAFTIDSSQSQSKSRSANPGVWLPLLAACVWLYARGRFVRR